MRIPIQFIDEQDDYEPDESDFLDEIEIDLEDEYEDSNDCSACSGTGESHNPDYKCSWCKGLGYIKRKH